MLLKQPNILSLIAASAILITINKAQTIANDDGGELDTFELDCDENELDCDFYDEDDDDDYEDEFYDYSGDGEELPDSVQPIPFDFGGEEDVSVNDFVRRIKAPKPPRKLKDKTSRKLGVVYNGWKAASRMLQHIVTNTELDRKRFIRKLLNYRQWKTTENSESKISFGADQLQQRNSKTAQKPSNIHDFYII